MIGRAHRFHGYNSLKYVYQQGKNTRGTLFAVRSVINHHRQSFRVAVVVSKKVSKSAVVRNRIRRRLYEQVRLQTVNIVRPYDIVLTVFSNTIADIPTDELKSQVESLLRQAGLTTSVPQSQQRGIIDQKD